MDLIFEVSIKYICSFAISASVSQSIIAVGHFVRPTYEPMGTAMVLQLILSHCPEDFINFINYKSSFPV